MRSFLVALLVAGSALATSPARAADAPTKLLRFPDISGDQVVFSYGGDLWKASTSGGLATRLTAHPGVELFAKFSPDGKWIAFTGQYDGDEQVYVIPAEGGEPRQLTFYPAHGPLAPRWGYDNQVYGWTPDGKKVLFRSLRDEDFGRTLTALYTVGLDGGLPTELPMPTSGAGDFSPDGKRIVYSPLFRDFRSWKRYQGGWAEDLFIFDLASHAVTPIAHSPRTERDPMWVGDAIYFVSDRDGTLNLYRSDLTGQKVEELTHSKSWDLKWASSDNDHQIVYEAGDGLELYDTTTNTATRLAIHVPDDGINRRPGRVSAADQIEDFELAPHGERALFSARGDIFTAPIEKGPTRNLTDSSRAHDKLARWSHDGRRIAYVSDRSGEDQIWVVDQDGSKPAAQLTTTLRGMLYAPAWSPDDKRIAFSDKNGKIYVLGVDDKKLAEIADDDYGLVQDYSWSPDSAWLAYSLGGENDNRSLWIWSVADGKARRISDGTFDEESPTWDPDGKYLYYLSEHEFAPQISLLEWNFAGNRMTGIFALALRKDVPNPFPAQSDEVRLDGKAKDEPASESAKKGDEAAKPVGIDFDGLAGRVATVPVEADQHRRRRGRPRGSSLLDLRRPVLRTRELREGEAALLRRREAGIERAGGRRARLGGLGRRQEGPGLRGQVLRALRRRRQAGRSQGGFDLRARGRPGSDPGVGRDLRRSLAPLPRLLLRPQHARLRLEGDRGPLPDAAARRGFALGPQLRPDRDGGRAQHRPRLHRRRRLAGSRAARGRAARAPVSRSTRPAAGTASRRSSMATTRNRSTARRSRRSASTPASATTCSRSTASTSPARTTRTGSCATRPTR